MSYRYAAAPGYKPTHGHSPAYTYSAAGSSAAASQGSTSERWQTIQGPAIHLSPATSNKEVRFVAPNDPSSPLLYPGNKPRTGGSPMSPDNMYYSPNTPSLSYATPDFEDDVMECPDTPLLKPRSLEPEDEPSLFSPNSSVYASRYEIDCVLYELNSLAHSYHYPTELDFQPAHSSQTVPALAYTAKNRPFLEHIQKLEKLQNRLDAIQSYGDEDIRKARKAAGAKVERALDELTRVQAMIWKQLIKSQRRRV